MPEYLSDELKILLYEQREIYNNSMKIYDVPADGDCAPAAIYIKLALDNNLSLLDKLNNEFNDEIVNKSSQYCYDTEPGSRCFNQKYIKIIRKLVNKNSGYFEINDIFNLISKIKYNIHIWVINDDNFKVYKLFNENSESYITDYDGIKNFNKLPEYTELLNFPIINLFLFEDTDNERGNHFVLIDDIKHEETYNKLFPVGDSIKCKKMNLKYELNINYTNSEIKYNDYNEKKILVLCANNNTINNEKSVKILKKNNLLPINYNIYYVGEDINENVNLSKNNIYKGTIENNYYNIVQNKYDIIINEFCPIRTNITIYTENFYELLNKIIHNNSLFITHDKDETFDKNKIKYNNTKIEKNGNIIYKFIIIFDLNLTIDKLKEVNLNSYCLNHDKPNLKCKLFDENKLIEIINVVNKQYNIINKLYIQKLTVKPSDNIIIIGDIHCNLKALIDIILDLNNKQILNNRFILNKRNHIVFLGDMIDRGQYGIEVLFLVLLLKYKNSKNVHIINGNHEDLEMYTAYGFMNEMKTELKTNTINLVNNFLTRIPCAIFLQFEGDEKYFQLCHGGIDETFNKNYNTLNFYNNIMVLNDIEYDVNGFKWSDFDLKTDYYIFNYKRDAGIITGIKYTETYLNKFKIHSIISGHQDRIPLGFLANENKSLYENNKTYNLYHLKDNNKNKLNPTNDFKALVTSNRITVDSNANADAIYLILSQTNNEKKEGGNRSFYKKYLKYKKKYLMLKN